MTAAVITAAATIIAAVIAAVAVSGGDESPPTASAAGPAGTSTTASASVEPSSTPSEPSADPSDPPLQTLPADTVSATPHARPRLIATPDRGPEAALVTLNATGFAPDEQIRITFRDSGGYDKDLRDVTAGPDGSLAAEVHVPKETVGGSDTPVFIVYSLDDDDADNQVADTPFTVTD
ncbi:hypothetical protein RJT17_20640 [Streptomyces sp. P5-A9]|uniref:hypothetical protein n=1 Tax=Streptomyces sp. P5-A9 TaxID=3071730 RepID=UPI002FC753A0